MCGTLLGTTALAACEDSATGPDLQNQLVVGGIAYHVKSFVIAESFPVQLGVTVEIENQSGTSQSVVFPDGCVVLMKAYDLSGALVWDLGDDVGCTLALVEIDLSPGETEEYQAGLVSAATILGDDLPDGEYRIAVYLRPNGQTVELDAGMADLGIPRN
jgi:hypothetical protein